MNVEDRIRETLRDWAAEAPVDGDDAVMMTPRRTNDRRPVLAAIATLVAVACIGAVVLLARDETDETASSTSTPNTWTRDEYMHGVIDIRSAPITRVPLEKFREGITPIRLHGINLLVGRRDGSVWVLLASSPVDGNRLTYCRQSGWIESSTRGDMYDETGARAIEYSPRPMTKVASTVEGDTLVIDFGGLDIGSALTGPPAPQPRVGRHCVTPGPWTPTSGGASPPSDPE